MGKRGRLESGALTPRSQAAKKAWRTRKRKVGETRKAQRRKGKKTKVVQLKKLGAGEKAILTIKHKLGLEPLERARGRKVTVPKITKETKNVVQLNGKERFKHQWYVPSKTDPSKVYKVTETKEGHFMCSCPSFTFQRGPIPQHKPCKHILTVKWGGYSVKTR